MRLLYKPLGALVGAAGGLMAAIAFKQVWRRIGHDDDAPKATDRDRGWLAVLVAAALQGAVFGVVKAAVDRAGASGYERLTGVWPGNESKPARGDRGQFASDWLGEVGNGVRQAVCDR